MDDEEVEINSSDEDLNEQISSKYKQNKTVDNSSGKKKKAGIEDSINLGNIKDKLNTTDVDLMTSLKTSFNYEALFNLEILYSSMIKEFELKKINYDTMILKFFDIISQDYDIYELEFTFSSSDKKFRKAVKQYFLNEIIIYGLLYMRELSNISNHSGVCKNEQIFNAFKNSLFYLHQNLLITMFIISHKAGGDLRQTTTIFLDKCRKKVEENKIWLNKSNFKKYMTNNNKICNNIVKNILQLLRLPESGMNADPCNNHNLTILINYLRNIGKFKIEVMRDNIYKLFIKNRYEIPSMETTKVESVMKDLTCIKDTESQLTNEELIEQHISEMPSPVPPFLPKEISNEKQYTLVLDLDETLVHYVEDSDSAYIQIRPGAELFLEEMAKYYEIVIFTAAMQDVFFYIIIILVCRFSIR
jgi:hypothetical protein